MLMMSLLTNISRHTEGIGDFFNDNENIGGDGDNDACQESRSKTQGRRRGRLEQCALQAT